MGDHSPGNPYDEVSFIFFGVPVLVVVVVVVVVMRQLEKYHQLPESKVLVLRELGNTQRPLLALQVLDCMRISPLPVFMDQREGISVYHRIQ